MGYIHPDQKSKEMLLNLLNFMKIFSFEIPSGMIEKLLANPFAGDGTLHTDLHLIFVDEVCGLFKLAGIPDDVVKGRSSLYL